MNNILKAELQRIRQRRNSRTTFQKLGSAMCCTKTPHFHSLMHVYKLQLTRKIKNTFVLFSCRDFLKDSMENINCKAMGLLVLQITIHMNNPHDNQQSRVGHSVPGLQITWFTVATAYKQPLVVMLGRALLPTELWWSTESFDKEPFRRETAAKGLEGLRALQSVYSCNKGGQSFW